jgi:two-component system copper resistance phosphate regulon response regulator CusR
MRILIAEDDSPLASFLCKGLSSEQYAVDVAADGEEAAHLAAEYDYDLMILDLNLPRVEGFQVIRNVKQKKPALPILILSGRSKLEDRVKGLDMGADDYITKPFSFTELSARVRAVMRRARQPAAPILRVADLELNRVERVVARGQKRIELTPKEFTLLEYLMRNQGRTVTRAMIIEHVWNLSFDTMTNVVDVYINYLRKKIDDGFPLRLIRTVRGVGYVLGQGQKNAA